MGRSEKSKASTHFVSVFETAADVSKGWRQLLKDGVCVSDIGFLAEARAFSRAADEPGDACETCGRAVEEAPRLLTRNETNSQEWILSYRLSLICINTFCKCGALYVSDSYPLELVWPVDGEAKRGSLADALEERLPRKHAEDLEESIHEGAVLLWARMQEPAIVAKAGATLLQLTNHPVRTFTMNMRAP